MSPLAYFAGKANFSFEILFSKQTNTIGADTAPLTFSRKRPLKNLSFYMRRHHRTVVDGDRDTLAVFVATNGHKTTFVGRFQCIFY